MASGGSLGSRIGLGIVGTLFGGAAFLVGRRLYGDRVVRKRARALLPSPSNETFDPAMVADLPEPVKRYFLHALAPGTPLEPGARLTARGQMRLSKDDAWRPMEAVSLLCPPRGFVWKARVGSGRSRFAGYDWLEGEDAGVEFYAIGAVPVAHSRGLDVRRSAAGRLAAESILVPASLLPSRGVRWEVEGPDAIRATLRIAGEPHAVTLVLDAAGRVLRASLLRWGNQTVDKRHCWIPFGVDVDEERSFGGVTIPSSVRVAWW
jgi:hypothetical protein